MNQKSSRALLANLQFFVHRLYSAGILTRPGFNGVAATCSISKLPLESKCFESGKRSRSFVLRSRVSSWTFEIDRKMIWLAFFGVGGAYLVRRREIYLTWRTPTAEVNTRISV